MKKQLNLVYIGLALLSVISCRSPKENDIEPDTTPDSSGGSDTNSGYAVFWTASQKFAGENIEIYLQPANYPSDILLGKITKNLSSAPGCDALENGYVRFKAAPGTYKIRAAGLNGTRWDATSITITQNGCHKLEFR